MGIQNFVANLAGVTAPVITGLVVDRTGSFAWAFVIAAVMLVLVLVTPKLRRPAGV